MPAPLNVQQAHDDLWSYRLNQLLDLGLSDFRARSIIGMTYKMCGWDATRTGLVLGRVLDSRTVSARNVVAYLRQEVSR